MATPQRLHPPDRLVCIATWSDTETRLRERRVEYRREHLGYALLYHPVHDSGYAQHALAAAGLWHLYSCARPAAGIARPGIAALAWSLGDCDTNLLGRVSEIIAEGLLGLTKAPKQSLVCYLSWQITTPKMTKNRFKSITWITSCLPFAKNK